MSRRSPQLICIYLRDVANTEDIYFIFKKMHSGGTTNILCILSGIITNIYYTISVLLTDDNVHAENMFV